MSTVIPGQDKSSTMKAHRRLSINQATTRLWSLKDLLDSCVCYGISGVGLWRESVAAMGLRSAARLLEDRGVAATSLCRGGFFTATDVSARKAAWAENRKAIEEAAELGAPELVLVTGGLVDGSRDLAGARGLVRDALDYLVPFAHELGVRLALEPLHPMFCADRAVVSTLGQALGLVRDYSPDDCGICVDTYHVWWDPELAGVVPALAGRIALYQVADWVVPLAADALLSRGHLGEGCIDFCSISELIQKAGYQGMVEVEIFRSEVWAAPGQETLERVISSFDRLVAPALGSLSTLPAVTSGP